MSARSSTLASRPTGSRSCPVRRASRSRWRGMWSAISVRSWTRHHTSPPAVDSHQPIGSRCGGCFRRTVWSSRSPIVPSSTWRRCAPSTSRTWRRWPSAPCSRCLPGCRQGTQPTIGRQPPGSPIRVRPSVPWTVPQTEGDRVITRYARGVRGTTTLSPSSSPLLYPGHHQRVSQTPLAAREFAFDPFVRETQTFIEADGTGVVGIHEKFNPDQAKVVVGDVEKRFHELAPDTTPLKLIVNHDVRDLAAMAQSTVKDDQAGRADDATLDLCHELVIIRVESLDLALLIQQPLRWDIQRPSEHTWLQADSNNVCDVLDPHRADHDRIGHPAPSSGL